MLCFDPLEGTSKAKSLVESLKKKWEKIAACQELLQNLILWHDKAWPYVAYLFLHLTFLKKKRKKIYYTNTTKSNGYYCIIQFEYQWISCIIDLFSKDTKNFLVFIVQKLFKKIRKKNNLRELRKTKKNVEECNMNFSCLIFVLNTFDISYDIQCESPMQNTTKLNLT